MKRVFLAIAHPDERSALRLMLAHLNLQLVGEAGDWLSALARIPATNPDMVLVDWGLVRAESGKAFVDLRKACTNGMRIVLISLLDAREQAAESAGADAFISKGEMPERIIERLRAVAESLPL